MYFGLNFWLANQKMWDKCVSNMKGIHIQMTSWIFFPQMCKILCTSIFLIYKNNGLSQSAYMDVTPLFWFGLIWFCMGWGFLFCFALLLFETITKVKKMFYFLPLCIWRTPYLWVLMGANLADSHFPVSLSLSMGECPKISQTNVNFLDLEEWVITKKHVSIFGDRWAQKSFWLAAVVSSTESWAVLWAVVTRS